VKLDFGYGSALAVALMVITLAVSSVLFAMRTSRAN
jgi:ABC-type sugar transport system permease subunit